MAAVKTIHLKLKKELSEAELEPVKAFIEQKLKAVIKKERIKGKRQIWLMKARKPELLTVDGINLAFKRAKLLKMLALVEVEEGS